MTNKNQTCVRCVMDSTDKNIVFNSKGECNHCIDWFKYNNEASSLKKIDPVISEIKAHSKDHKYDCILGLSGGVDSSYIAHLAKKEFNLNPLIVHLDNGWNSKTAVRNIKKIVQKNEYDLYTYVIDWEEFKQMQQAYFKAGVIDIEALTDHAIHNVLYKVAKEYNVKYILKGFNTKSEFIMPKAWTFNKLDFGNIKDIVKQNADIDINSFPLFDKESLKEYREIVKSINVFDYYAFVEKDVKDALMKEYDWKPYDGKHYESVFTRFYQAYILPNKFNVDKRKAHYSNLICMKEMTRTDALEKLKYSDYDLLEDDLEYVVKKLELTESFFETYMKSEPISHFKYKTNLKSKISKKVNLPNMFLNKFKYK